MKPKCSVVIPTYNSDKYIELSLMSVLNQTVIDIEIIVIDDGSMDDTKKIIEGMAKLDKRIRLIAHTINLGVAKARNHGVFEAKSDWIAFLDSDDIWLPNKLEKQLKCCELNSTAICYADAVILNHRGEFGGAYSAGPIELSHNQLLRGNCIVASSVLVRKDYMLRFPMRRDDLHEDYLCWLELTKEYGPAISVAEPLVGYRLTEGSKSRNKFNSAWKTWLTYRAFGLSKKKTWICFYGYVIHAAKRYLPITYTVLKNEAGRWFYKTIGHRWSLFTNLAFHIKLKPYRYTTSQLKKSKIKIRGKLHEKSSKRYPEISELSFLNTKIAVVSDEMTWNNFQDVCKTVFIEPDSWLEQMDTFKPNVFFCESAWAGIKEDSWRWKIYRNQKLWFENRKPLLDILEYCHKERIPTVFWNKEDPLFFSDPEHDFTQTALLFDYIFTTDRACIKKYKSLGHTSVHELMFGISPTIFPKDQTKIRNEAAVFVGGWYCSQVGRCNDLCRIFDKVLDAGIELQIYDRYFGSYDSEHFFPLKYKPYIKPSVPYGDLKNVFHEAKYGINVNTITNSETMFARRVFEMMSCGLLILSNESVGLRQLFGQRICFLDDKLEFLNSDQIRNINMEEIHSNHLWKQRILDVIDVIDQSYSPLFGCESIDRRPKQNA